MACVCNDGGGKRRIQFVSPEGKRKAIHLGRISQNGASTICVHVEHVLASKRSGLAVEAKTATWIADLPERLAKKLAKAGLIDPPEAKDSATLGTFIDEYIECRSDIKARTAERLRQAKAKLVECFGSAKPLRQFTTADADTFRQWLVNQGLAENTVRRLCGRAKQFFRAAMRRKLIVENPFADLVSAVRGNPGRLYFVTRQEASDVLDACPDAEWRLLFALARFGGLRTPSESLSLKWGDVDWANGRIRVPSPKTEHIEGKESRLLPIFPELRPHLEAAWEQAPEGAEHVINRYRGGTVNLRTQLERIIKRAGLTPWGKPWQNLRSTRETELMETFPSHVVCAWIGNSESVARTHYLQVTNEHFRRAVDVAQNTAQNLPALARTPKHAERVEEAPPEELRSSAGMCWVIHPPLVPPTGVEPVSPD